MFFFPRVECRLEVIVAVQTEWSWFLFCLFKNILSVLSPLHHPARRTRSPLSRPVSRWATRSHQHFSQPSPSSPVSRWGRFSWRWALWQTANCTFGFQSGIAHSWCWRDAGRLLNSFVILIYWLCFIVVVVVSFLQMWLQKTQSVFYHAESHTTSFFFLFFAGLNRMSALSQVKHSSKNNRV